MKTTLTKCFEGGLFAGLARVNRSRDKKEMLQNIAAEACVSIDMAKGLQGRGDWVGSVSKLYAASDCLIQAIDLAETFAGVQMAKTRTTVDGAANYLREADTIVDIDPLTVRPEVKKCELALEGAAKVIRTFADNLYTPNMAKSGEFSEQELLDAVYGQGMEKYYGSGDVDEARARAAGERAASENLKRFGLTTPSEGAWEDVPGKPGRQRRKSGFSGYEYRDKPGMRATAEKVLDENGAKIEKPEGEEVETSEDAPAMAEKNLHKSLNFGRFFAK